MHKPMTQIKIAGHFPRAQLSTTYIPHSANEIAFSRRRMLSFQNNAQFDFHRRVILNQFVTSISIRKQLRITANG